QAMPAPWFDPQPDIRGAVVGDAAAALGSDGLLLVDRNVQMGPGAAPVVSADYATQLADAFVKSYGPSLETTWETERGGPITLPLTPSSRIYPARTTFSTFPEGCHPSFARLFGSYYLLTMRQGGSQVLKMAVSEQTSD